MIRFRTLGGVDLRDTSGRELRSVLAQPKRLALLAYLAIATPAGYHRRDSVLALFWPELDQERARGALRQAVHFLRRTLGAGVVRGHGGEDIGLGDDVVWCDARAFDDALSRGVPGEALDLYNGDLLNGFFVSDASSDFEAWLDHERGRLRQRAIEAAWTLTDQHEAAGRGADAARWARWAVTRAPDDERTQRRLVSLLDRLGDRTGALRAYEQFTRRARDEFDAEPSPETRALVAAIRARNTVGPHIATPDIPFVGSSPTLPLVPVSPVVPVVAVVPALGARIPRGWVLATVTALATVAISAYAIRSAHAVAAPVFSSRVPLMWATTSSPVASHFFEAGLRALYDQGDAHLARSLFLDALNYDSTFAMAAFYVARCDGEVDATEASTMMVRAVRLADHASERERLIIRASWATMVEDPDRMEIAESLATRYPDEPEGHIALATALTGMGDFLGAVPHLRRVIDSDTLTGTSEPPLCSSCLAFENLVGVYLLADSLLPAERVAREWVRRQPRSTLSLSSLRDVLAREGRARDANDVERRLTALDPSADADLAAAIIASHVDDWAEADRLMLGRLRYGGTDAVQTALWWLVIVRRNEGRLTDALVFARRFEALGAPAPPPQIAVLAEAQVLFEQGHVRDAARLFDSLAALPPNPSPTAPGAIARHRSWFLTHAATAWAAAGDTARLARLADAVEGSARLSAYGRDWHLPHYLRGLLWKARGDRVQSLHELQRSIWSPSEGYTRANLELARAWLALGQPRAAVTVLQAALRGPIEASNFYLTRTEVHELLARSFAAAGETDSAAAHYDVVARSWRDGDAVFRQRAAAAAAQHARLTQLLSAR
jgi:DNA-binding SARP family transcriptional activator